MEPSSGHDQVAMPTRVCEAASRQRRGRGLESAASAPSLARRGGGAVEALCLGVVAELNSLQRLRAWLTSLLPDVPPTPPPEDLAAFDVLRKVQDFRNWRLALVFSAIATVVWWPTDLLLFAPLPNADEAMHEFVWARAIAAITTTLLVIAAQTSALVRRHALPLFGLGALIVCFFAGFHFGAIGGPGEPWFHFGHFVVLPPIAITMGPYMRLLVTALFAVAFSAGFFGMHPANFADPYTGASLNYLLFATVFAYGAGIVTDRMRKGSFLVRRLAERQAEELRRLKAGLEERVEAATSEVRQLLQHMESAREAERSRLARELHDELGQELTALRYAVELARRRYAQDPAGITSNLAEIDALLQRARLATREVVTDLRPHVLDDLGLPIAAEQLARRVEKTGLTVHFEAKVDDAHAPNPEIATAGYRILQECLTNVVRHANATHVTVSLREEGKAIVLSVSDDGRGFDPKAPKQGFGLLGMRERAAALGIGLTIDSEPGRGTRITARMRVFPKTIPPMDD